MSRPCVEQGVWSSSNISPLGLALIRVCLAGIALLAVVSQSTALQWLFYPMPLSVLGMITLFPLSVAAWFQGLRIALDRDCWWILGLIFIPFWLSAASVLGTLAVDHGIYDKAYFGYSSYFGRTVNFTFFLYYFLFCHSALRARNSELWMFFVRWYFGAVGIMVLLGLWQWTHFYLKVPFPNLSSLHTNISSSVGEADNVVAGRLTSFFREPAYFASFVWDFLILTPLLLSGTKRSLVISASVFCLLFSYSFGGFIEAIIVGSSYAVLGCLRFLRSGTFRTRSLLVATFGLSGISIVIFYALKLVLPLVARLQYLGEHPLREIRVQEMYAAIYGSAHGSWWQTLFGFGPSSYELLTRHNIGLTYPIIHTTSNSTYADILFEQGVLGLACLLVLLVNLQTRAAGLYFTDRKLKPIPTLVIALVASGFYKVDHTQLRFWVLTLIVLGCFHYLGEQRGYRYPASRRCSAVRT